MRIAPITFEQGSEAVGNSVPPLIPTEGEFHQFMERVGATKTGVFPTTKQATHVVERGQNLWQICRDCLESQGKRPSKADVHRAVMQVAKSNGLRDPDILSVGQKLDLAGLHSDGAAARELAAAARAQARVGALTDVSAGSISEPRTVNAPPAPLPRSGPAMPEGTQRFAMPERVSGPAMPDRKQRFAMPEPSGAGKNRSAMGLPAVPPAGVPPLSPHPVRHAASQGGGPGLPTSGSRKSVDITGLIQSILEPGSMDERDGFSTSPWSRILGGPARLTSKFGMRKDPFTGRPQFHDGVDIAAKSGTEIYPSMPGKVTFSGWKAGYGRVVVVEHPNGLETAYGHTSKILVKAGDTVTANTPIAHVGSTGRSTGPHLHFEVRRNDVPFDPMPLLTGESLHVAEAL